MIEQRNLALLIGITLGLSLLIYLLSDVLAPFVAGFILAYLLNPLADRLERVKIGSFRLGRLGATIIILGSFFLIVGLFLLIVGPMMFHQLIILAGKLPGYAQKLQAIAVEYSGPLLERFGGPASVDKVKGSLSEVAVSGTGWLVAFLQSLWTGSRSVIATITIVIITPVVAFYLLLDWPKIAAAVDVWVPRRHQTSTRFLLHEIDGVIAGFFRGQSLLCLCLGSFYAITLTMMGLNFGALIGLLTGILAFIPYVGSISGFVLSTGIAIVQFWPDWIWPTCVVGIFLIGQFLEGNVLAPKLVGASVGLHPVWLMFALLAFGSLFGFTGLLIAVPLAAVIGVLIRFGLRRYLTSSFYSVANEQSSLPPLQL